jgi:hypothetical protein
MTLTAAPPGPPPGPVTGMPARPAPARRPRRWHRAAIPFALLAVFWAGTWLAHLIEEPDLGDPGTLSPTGTGPDGSSRLADLLTERGVRVERVTSSADAIRAAGAGDATVFLPGPDLLFPSTQTRLAAGPGAVRRIVVVRPGVRSLIATPAPVVPAAPGRWAAAVTAPRCAAPVAAGAGPAAVLRDRYDVDGVDTLNCYSGAVVGVRVEQTEFVFVGASDPFRNSRIGEHGNAALAVGLLAVTDRVIWVDVHKRETVPRGSPELNLPEYRRGDQDRGGTGFPTIDAFPPLMWAVLVLAAGATVLLAFARARRLGPPVAEPLPVLVPAAETVTGRGRLYQRIAARSATLAALQSAAIARLARLVDPFGVTVASDRTGPPQASDELVRGISLRTATPEETVRAILHGPAGDSDSDLARAVADLDALVAAVLGGAPPHARPDHRHGGGPQ